MSVRARLLLGVLVVTAVAMAALGVAVFSSIDRYLTHRVDEDLQRSAAPSVAAAERGVAFPPDRPEERPFAQSRFYNEVRDATGATVRVSPAIEGNSLVPAPDLSGLDKNPDVGVQYYTTGSVTGSPDVPGRRCRASTTACR